MEPKLVTPLIGGLDAGAIAGALIPELKRIVERRMDEVCDSLRGALEDGRSAANRTLKRTRYAALDEVDELQHTIKRQPLLSVAAACGLGISIGLLIPLLFRRKGNPAGYYQ